MLDSNKALNVILKEVTTLVSEKVKLRIALGRTLAKNIVADENIPSFDNSSMDGIAVHAADILTATKKKPVTILLVGESSAGNVYGARLKRGEAIRIMTGAKIPDGADCVVPIELVNITDERSAQFVSSGKVGAYIRRAGEDIRRKEVALPKGELLGPPHLGVLASLGCSKIEVTRKPNVHILATGDELVEVSQNLPEGKIRNSSSYTLAGFVKQAGGTSTVLGIVRDRKKRLRSAIKDALDCDILLITGGVSVGKYDLVKDTLEEIGVVIKFWRVNIKPGRPLLFGTYGDTLVFGLPGNPASTSVTFLQFVQPAMEKMLGRSSRERIFLSAILDEPIIKKDGKRHFVRGIATSSKGVLHVCTTGTQSSGVMSSMAKANCFIILPEKSSSLKKGSRVEVQMMSEFR